MTTTFELDDLKIALQRLDRRLEQQASMQLRALKTRARMDIRKYLYPLGVGQVIQIVCGLFISLIFGPFWVKYLDVPHLMIDGILLHAYGLMLIGFAVRDLLLIRRIDYTADVLHIQKSLAELRSWRLCSGLWFAAAGCFMWVPLTLICLYWAGVDIWIDAPGIAFAFLASGFACFATGYGLTRFARRPGQAGLARFLDESAVGRRLKHAQTAIAELESFEKE